MNWLYILPAVDLALAIAVFVWLFNGLGTYWDIEPLPPRVSEISADERNRLYDLAGGDPDRYAESIERWYEQAERGKDAK